MSQSKSIFDQFTRKYSLLKTLRFELRPVGNTQYMLDKENVFEKDRIIQEKYNQTKPFFDRLHREFIEQSLKGRKLSGLSDYFGTLKELQANKKNRGLQKKFADISQTLRTRVKDLFHTDSLFGEEVFTLLKTNFGNEDGAFLRDREGRLVLDADNNKVSIFDSWKGFTGYFTKFQETRKNLYKDDGTATAIATRVVDQNLKRFCDNIQTFRDIKSKVDFREVESELSVNLDTVFSLDHYNLCLLQGGINSYNKVLGGEVKESGNKLRGLNEIVNQYRQDHKAEKPPFFKLLDKQILSEKDKFIESIETDEELLQILKKFYSAAESKTHVIRNLLGDFFLNNNNYDLTEVYISKEALNTIFHRWVAGDNLSELEKGLYDTMKKDKPSGLKFDKADNSYTFPDFVALAYLKNALDAIAVAKLWKDGYFEDSPNSNHVGPLAGDEPLWWQFLKVFEFEFNSLFSSKPAERPVGYDHFKADFEKVIKNDGKKFAVSPEEKIIIREFADNVLSIYQMAKYFALEKKRKWLDEYDTSDFYSNPEIGYKTKFYDDAYDQIVRARMLLQSYLTKKPYSTKKWKLNFENPTLANGFDKNKESDNSTVILRKNRRYYAAIMKRGCNKIFSDRYVDELAINTEAERYEKMVYKFFPDPAKMFPKVCFSKKGLALFDPPEEILRIYKRAEFKKGEDFSTSSMQKLIDFYKQALAKYGGWKDYDYVSLKPTREYKKNIGEFFRDVAKDGYKLSFASIPAEYIEGKNEAGELYLFEIHNKDWNLKNGTLKTGAKNVHTLYFESVFSEENQKHDFPYKLNGQAELFFRPKTDNAHLKRVIDRSGREVISHKRYAENKIFFHVPITLNRSAGNVFRFNQAINEFLADNPDINIIGVDRGEKHLIYYAGIDQQGRLLTDKDGKPVMGSLNEINGQNYYKLLEDRAQARKIARQDWQNIQGIKDLKMGYISLVVRKLADLIIEHNAIIVLEDLNMRFKQIRGGIEKSVYQQLERALIEKLNFLVNKGETDPEKAGHLLRAYQLTAPFITFKDLGKQTGLIFYTQASYTSKTCPQCGFRPNIGLRYESQEKAKVVVDKINIKYENGCFAISYKPSDFIKNQVASKRGNTLYGSMDRENDFTLSTKDATRYKWTSRGVKESDLRVGESKLSEETGKGVTLKYDITQCLVRLFNDHAISYTGNLTKELAKDLPPGFYRDLLFYIYLLTNTRSSVSGTNIDYINCPRCGFHSEGGFSGCSFNGDANGAYNIARKGIMVLEKISQYKQTNNGLDKMTWGDLFIDIEEWDKFRRNQWNPASKSQK